ncbi:MAG: MBL fold metallo-hydrolase [Candidatus Pacebacteria bacterium]|nr:MBL fold metallo-hydrolase [Candidatus Paceibacterota bacterium]
MMRQKIFFYFLVALILANIFNWWVIVDYLNFPKGKVSFLNVGQGDAELIQTKSGNFLIDAGPSEKTLEDLAKILPFYDRTIDLFILSHPEKDHYTGLFKILENYKIRAMIISNQSQDDGLYQELIKKIKEKNILIVEGVRGVKVHWGSKDNLLFLYPPEFSSFKGDNESSSVIKLNLGLSQFLFTGDIGFKQEESLVPFLGGDDSVFRVLKVAHHGSRYSSSLVFLEKFKPWFSIIEVGKNNYNHPHPDALERLKETGTQIWRTDLEGGVQFIIDTKNRIIKKNLDN